MGVNEMASAEFTIKVAGANEVKGRLNGNIMSVQVMNGEDNSTITTDNPREMRRVADAIERLIEARNLLGG